MSASALLLIEPTNEMTRSSSGIRIANAPAEKINRARKLFSHTDENMICGHCKAGVLNLFLH